MDEKPACFWNCQSTKENRQNMDAGHFIRTLRGGIVDVIMDFTDPIIRGMSVCLCCHLLNHEDKGMMAKILFE